MNTLEKWLMGTLAVAALAIALSQRSQTKQVIDSLAGGYSKVLGTLTGNSVF